MSEAIEKYQPLSPEVRRKVILHGDLSGLNDAQLEEYYLALCRYLNLEPSTRPFNFLKTRQGLILYVNNEAFNQLRRLHNISCRILEEGFVPGTQPYRVKSESRDPDGRIAEDIGVTDCEGLRGADLANAMMKTVTKAHNRSTKRLIGISLPDENEAETIPGAVKVVSAVTGNGEPHAVAVDSQPEPPPVRLSTVDQRKYIHGAKRKLQLSEDEYRALLAEYGVQSSKELTVEQASDLIERLRAMWDERQKTQQSTEPKPEQTQEPQSADVLEQIKHQCTRLGFNTPETIAIRSAITSAKVEPALAAQVLSEVTSKTDAIEGLRMLGVPNPFKTQQVSAAAGSPA